MEEQPGCAAARSPRRAPDRARAARLPPNATARASCGRAHLRRGAGPGAGPACGQVVDCNVVGYRCAPVRGPGRRLNPAAQLVRTDHGLVGPMSSARRGSLTNCCATRGRAAQPAQPGRHAGATQLVQTGVETTSAQLGTHRLMAHALIDALVDTPGLRVRFRCRGFDQTTRPHRRGRLASAAPSREGSACRAGSWCCVAPPV